MKKNILFILFIVLFMGFKFEVKSLSYGGCEYSQISRLKSIVSNINITHDYYIQNNQAYFNITLSNLVPEIYFIDSKNKVKYTYANSQNGQITIYNQTDTQVSYKFYSNLNMCPGVKLSTKYYNLPIYNLYYNSDLCKGIENYNLCKKWTKNNYSYDEFKEVVDKYKQQKEKVTIEDEIKVTYEKTLLNYFIDFYVKYYYLLLIGIIVICFIIMYINRKKNKFDL